MFRVSKAFMGEKNRFSSHSGHKTAAAIDDNGDSEMVCSYLSSCLYLPVTLFDCQINGCEFCLHHVYQGEYVPMHDIDLDKA